MTPLCTEQGLGATVFRLVNFDPTNGGREDGLISGDMALLRKTIADWSTGVIRGFANGLCEDFGVTVVEPGALSPDSDDAADDHEVDAARSSAGQRLIPGYTALRASAVWWVIFVGPAVIALVVLVGGLRTDKRQSVAVVFGVAVWAYILIVTLSARSARGPSDVLVTFLVSTVCGIAAVGLLWSTARIGADIDRPPTTTSTSSSTTPSPSPQTTAAASTIPRSASSAVPPLVASSTP